MTKKIAVLPGDGIGPEVTEAAVRVLQAAGDRGGLEFRFDTHLIGAAALRAGLPPLPPCVSWPLDEPNDRLLQPAFIQQLTRTLVAHGWTPAAIARRVHERYAADAGWGDHWTRRDRWTRAMFDVGVFAALIHVGLDEGVDFNCVSAMEKGLCPGTGCPYNLADIRDRMLAG